MHKAINYDESFVVLPEFTVVSTIEYIIRSLCQYLCNMHTHLTYIINALMYILYILSLFVIACVYKCIFMALLVTFIHHITVKCLINCTIFILYFFII